jgi:hypothetical protein
MLKIVSDPTVAPIREVNLLDAGEGLILTPVGAMANRNREFERPDGGLNVAFRRRRAEYDLTLRPLHDEQVRQLEELAGMQDYNLFSRVPVYLFPDFDASTILSFPGQRTTKAWVRKGDGSLEWRAPDQTGRSGDLYYTDRHGYVRKVGTSVSAFEPGVLGHHYLRPQGEVNLAAVFYPLSGGLGWTAGAGTPTLTFDSVQPSMVEGETGSMRVEAGNSGSAQFYPTTGPTFSSAVAGERHNVTTWMRGNVRVRAMQTVGAASSGWGPWVQLDPTRFTRIDSSLVSVDTSAVGTVLYDIEDTGNFRVLWVGGHKWTQFTNDGLHPLEPWGKGAEASESFRYDCDLVRLDPAGLSFTGAAFFPRGRHRMIWTQGAASGDYATLEFGDGVASWFLRSHNGGFNQQITIPQATWESWVGKPCVASFRRGPTEDHVEIAVQTDTVNWSKAGIERLSASQLGDHGKIHDATDLVLGSFGGWNPSTEGMSFYRMDGRYWSDAEMRLRERYVLEGGFRQVVRACQGRKFVLQDVQASAIPGTALYQAAVRAVEIDVDDELAVVS